MRIIGAATGAMVLAVMIAGAAQAANRTYPVAGFSAIDLRGSDDVNVRVGSGFSIRAEGDPRVIEQLQIERLGDTLRIARKPGFSWSWETRGVHIYVTLPRLRSIDLGGSGDVAIDRVDGPAFRARIGGSGTITIARLTAGEADLAIAGSGNLRAAGNVRYLRAALTGSGTIETSALRAAGADTNMTGSGVIRGQVNGPAKVAMIGSGRIDLGPAARCTIRKTGSGDVRCGR